MATGPADAPQLEGEQGAAGGDELGAGQAGSETGEVGGEREQGAEGSAQASGASGPAVMLGITMALCPRPYCRDGNRRHAAAVPREPGLPWRGCSS